MPAEGGDRKKIELAGRYYTPCMLLAELIRIMI